MKPPRTTYLITRVHGLRTHLVKREDMIAMIKARDFSEVLNILLKTDYSRQLSMTSEKDLDAALLEQVFLKVLVERAYFILKIAPPKVHELLLEFFRRFEVENLKRIIRSKHMGETIDASSLIPLGREHTVINFSALLAAKDVAEVVDLLKETVYSSLSERLKTYEDCKTPLVLEMSLDKFYYSRLWEKFCETLSEKEVVKLFKTEIELKNLLLILGMKTRDMNPNLIKESVVSLGDIDYEKKLSIVIKGKIEDAPDILRTEPHRKMMREAIDLYRSGGILEIDRLLNSHRYKHVLGALKRHKYDIGFVLLYIYLCEFEAANLVAIALGKQLGVGEEKLRELVSV